MCVCIFSFSAHGTVCTFVAHEYKGTSGHFCETGAIVTDNF